MGVSHRTAPIELRERIAVSADETPSLLQRLVNVVASREAFILATCNRVEIYAMTANVREEEIVRGVLIDRSSNLIRDDHLYEFKDRAAVRHLFRVVSSLDSMVVGEPQIAGQVKAAYAIAREAKTVGAFFHRLIHRAFRIAKRVRLETMIGEGSISIGSVAARLASQIFEGFENRLIALVGAGEMAEQTLDHLRALGAVRIAIANRSFERAQALASRVSATPYNLGDLENLLVEADIVLTSTSAQGYLITREAVRTAQRRRRYRPLLIVDIAVPRNVEPATGELDHVYLYDIDDMQGVTEASRVEREKAAVPAERLIDHEVDVYFEWRQSLEGLPLLLAMRTKAATIAKEEISKAHRRNQWTAETERSVDALVHSIVNRLLHAPSTYLKEQLADPDPFLLEIVRDLFDLKVGAETAQGRVDSSASPVEGFGMIESNVAAGAAQGDLDKNQSGDASQKKQ